MAIRIAPICMRQGAQRSCQASKPASAGRKRTTPKQAWPGSEDAWIFVGQGIGLVGPIHNDLTHGSGKEEQEGTAMTTATSTAMVLLGGLVKEGELVVEN